MLIWTALAAALLSGLTLGLFTTGALAPSRRRIDAWSPS